MATLFFTLIKGLINNLVINEKESLWMLLFFTVSFRKFTTELI